VVLDSASHRIFDCVQYKQQRIALLDTLEKHDVKPDIYAMMSFDGKSVAETKEIITALILFINETNLAKLFLWDPSDEEHGVEGIVLMKPVDTSWAEPQKD
jgi:hypothetical protein